VENDAQSSAGRLKRLDSLAYLLDNSIPIPGTGARVGIDALIGLVPGIGDVAGTAMSAYIVMQAARMGAPASVVARMVMNVGVETVVGSIPFLGDLFDAGWKANARNIKLLRAVVDQPGTARRSSRAVVIGAGLALLLILAVIGVVAFAVVRAMWYWLTAPGGPGGW
jgi:hypothetical protein